MSAPAMSTATKISTNASTCRTAGVTSSHVKQARHRPREHQRDDDADDPAGERDQLAHDAAREGKQRGQRDEHDHGKVESVHRGMHARGPAAPGAHAAHFAGATIPL